MSIVISLYDYTGNALIPWAELGFQCYAFDIQHSANSKVYVGDGEINYIKADLSSNDVMLEIADTDVWNVAFLSAFPPCTDLSSAGARWWKSKSDIDPRFQDKALSAVTSAASLAQTLGCPYYVENPIGAVSRLWRKPDHMFDPYEYGGYLPEDDAHPTYPDVIPLRDAYRKRTCLWAGGGFVMPEKQPVNYINVKVNRAEKGKGENFSPVSARTGGKSERTKNIRSATPRGFATAVCQSNQPKEY